MTEPRLLTDALGKSLPQLPPPNGNQHRQTFDMLEELSMRTDQIHECTKEELLGYIVVTLRLLNWPGQQKDLLSITNANEKAWLHDILDWMSTANTHIPFGIFLEHITKLMIRELLRRAYQGLKTHLILDHACGLQCNPNVCPYRTAK